MMGFLIAIHVIVCVLLIIIILIQAGRGGGLVEGFSGVESMFGPKTNAFLTRATTVLSSLFLITCITLAFFSVKQSRSLMRSVPIKHPASTTMPETKPQAQGTAETKKLDSPQGQGQNTQTQIPVQPETKKQETPKVN